MPVDSMPELSAFQKHDVKLLIQFKITHVTLFVAS
jgi:hypothetical protein